MNQQHTHKMPHSAAYRAKTIRRVTVVSAIIDGLLSLIKIIIGMWARSEALIADGIHSISDLATDILLIFAAHASSKNADLDHPYGHGRIETIASVILALVLIGVGFGVAYHALDIALHSSQHNTPNLIAVIAAMIAIISNEWLFRYSMKYAQQIDSHMLRSNAMHHRSDSLSSAVVLISVIASHFGLHYMDSIGAIIIAAFILQMGAKILWDCVKELVDTGVDIKMLDAIETTIKKTPGVEELHMLRTRYSANKIFADVHIIVDGRITVSEGHFIADQVYTNLKEQFPQIEDITVHTDAEDDETQPSCHNLPNRTELLKQCQTVWQECPYYDEIIHIHLHYISCTIQCELVFPLEISKKTNPETLLDCYKKVLETIPDLKNISLYFAYPPTHNT